MQYRIQIASKKQNSPPMDPNKTSMMKTAKQMTLKMKMTYPKNGTIFVSMDWDLFLVFVALITIGSKAMVY
jgi:hypothetical protein